MTEWEKILADSPSPAPFQITMAANSTTEVWDDIHTKLDQNHGWRIRGLRYALEAVDPTAPAPLMSSTLTNQRTIQLHRNDDSEVLLSAFDPDVIAHHSYGSTFLTSGLQVLPLQPFEVLIDTVTRSQVLRVLFRTYVDDIGISDSSIQIAGAVFYEIITAPDDGRTKLGIPIDEI